MKARRRGCFGSKCRLVAEVTIEEVRLEMSGIQGTIGSEPSASLIGPSAGVRDGASLYFGGEKCAGYPNGVDFNQAHLHFQPGIQSISQFCSGLKTVPFLPIQTPSKHLTLYSTVPNSKPFPDHIYSTYGRFLTGASVIDGATQVHFVPERNPFSRSFASP